MYSDDELIACPTCEAKGIFANDVHGRQQFFHKIPSPRNVGYFTFTSEHQLA